jgi:hypothetical protein
VKPADWVSSLFPGLKVTNAQPLSQGCQATVSTVELSGMEEIVVKEFMPAAGVDDALEDERAALHRLMDLVGGQTILGWTIDIPRVVAVSRQPPALALMKVPGTPIDILIDRGWLPPLQISLVLAEVFERYWRNVRRPIGDLNLSNLMCDPPSRRLAIVDPGLPNRTFELETEQRTFYPASRDLGCLLHQVASTNVRRSVTRPQTTKVRLAFVRSVIEACVSRSPKRDAFVEEIGDCATAHLSYVTGGPLGHRAWRAIVRRLAQQTVLNEMETLRIPAQCI